MGKLTLSETFMAGVVVGMLIVSAITAAKAGLGFVPLMALIILPVALTGFVLRATGVISDMNWDYNKYRKDKKVKE